MDKEYIILIFSMHIGNILGWFSFLQFIFLSTKSIDFFFSEVIMLMPSKFTHTSCIIKLTFVLMLPNLGLLSIIAFVRKQHFKYGDYSTH